MTWTGMTVIKSQDSPKAPSGGSPSILVQEHFPELYEKTYKMVTPQALLIKKLLALTTGMNDEADANWWQICDADTFEYSPKHWLKFLM